MDVSLIDLDGKMPNIALMKLASYYKKQGADIVFNCPMVDCDKTFVSKIFKTSTIPTLLKTAEIGGTGFDLHKRLPEEVENEDLDYSLYPDCDYSVGFLTRGCPNKCKFCVVPEKEGGIALDRHWTRWSNPNGNRYVFFDNNLLAHPDCIDILDDIAKAKIKVDFNQGLDIRLVTPQIAHALSKVRWTRFLRFSFDHSALKPAVERGLNHLSEAGIKPHQIWFYVLIGFDSTHENDLDRVEFLRSKGIDCFAMPFDRTDQYQRDFTRWVAHKAIFKSTPFAQYIRTKPAPHTELEEIDW